MGKAPRVHRGHCSLCAKRWADRNRRAVRIRGMSGSAKIAYYGGNTGLPHSRRVVAMAETSSRPSAPRQRDIAKHVETYRLTDAERRMQERLSAKTGMNFSQLVRRGLLRVAMEEGLPDLPPER